VTVLSARYALAAFALLLASALPVWLHAAIAPVHEDCAGYPAFVAAPRIGGAESVPPTNAIKRTKIDAEGRLRLSSRVVLSTRVVRRFDSWRFVSTPIAFGFNPLRHLEGGVLRWIDADGDRLPVRWNAGQDARTAQIEAYVYVQAGRPVTHPLRSSLALALPQLVGGTRPITLLLVSGVATPDEREALDRAAEAWLVAAWRQLEAACRP
jgi:hypothetical protein